MPSRTAINRITGNSLVAMRRRQLGLVQWTTTTMPPLEGNRQPTPLIHQQRNPRRNNPPRGDKGAVTPPATLPLRIPAHILRRLLPLSRLCLPSRLLLVPLRWQARLRLVNT